MKKDFELYHFNTSHVSINLPIFFKAVTVESDFNTSHVSINHNRIAAAGRQLHISIHLMFLLILCNKLHPM